MASRGTAMQQGIKSSTHTSFFERSRSAAAARASPQGSCVLGEIVEEPVESPAAAAAEEMEGDEDKVYVAVAKEGQANLSWVLHNTTKDKRIIVVHVHRPAHKIPTAMGWFPANQLKEEQVAAYRSIERYNMNKSLDEYIDMCANVKSRKAEKLVIEKDDVGKGLVELISKHGITKLVMGAAADKHYSRKLKAPKSKTALNVQQQADPSCKIWFVCGGKLICVRHKAA